MSTAEERPAHSTSPPAQAFGVTREVIDGRGRRGCLAPVVVHAGVAYAVALLEGPVSEMPAPLQIEALLNRGEGTPADIETNGQTGSKTDGHVSSEASDKAGSKAGEWVALPKLGTLANLTEPELQVSCWRAPDQARDFRVAAPWRTGADAGSGLPQTVRALPTPAADGSTGFWGPTLRRGENLACLFVSPTTLPSAPSHGAIRAQGTPPLHGRIDGQWFPLPFVQGVSGTSEDGVLVQLGRWVIDTDVTIDDVRLASSVTPANLD